MSFMTFAVVFCLGFTALMIIACYIARWFGVDTTHELTITATVFGGELGGLLLKKLLSKKGE